MLVLSILTVKLKHEVFPAVQRDPPVLHLVPTASCSVIGHHLEESGSVISTSSLQVLTDTDKIPLNLLFSQLNSPSSQPALIMGDAPVHAFMALPWALSSTSIPSLSREPTLDTCCRSMLQLQQCPTEGKDQSPAGTTPPHTVFFGAKPTPGKLLKWLHYSCES